MGYRLTFENEIYNQYSLRMFQRPNNKIELLRASKIINPPPFHQYFQQPSEKNVNNSNKDKNLFSDITGKGRFVNEYI